MELLAPAGNWEKLQIALHFGADAVYVGAPDFSLRALAPNFSCAQLKEACDYCHSRGKKLYLTLNAYLLPGQEEALQALLEELRPLPVDAYIVSDPGVLSWVRQIDPKRPLHLSTQANTTNAAAAEFWRQQGVERIILARELTLQQIHQLQSRTRVALEAFVHGAMCVAYSGRCLLSAALADRGANEGRCAQACRWRYALVEETRPGEYLPLVEDEQGSYVFNSRDLCLLGALPQLQQAGISSCKIEGRMKSLYYVAAVTRVYRAALDRLGQQQEDFVCDEAWWQELASVSHRPYTTGFLFPETADKAHIYSPASSYLRQGEFVGRVLEPAGQGRYWVEGRNRFHTGETLELIGPHMRTQAVCPQQIYDRHGAAAALVQPNARVKMALPEQAAAGDLLRSVDGRR